MAAGPAGRPAGGTCGCAGAGCVRRSGRVYGSMQRDQRDTYRWRVGRRAALASLVGPALAACAGSPGSAGGQQGGAATGQGNAGAGLAVDVGVPGTDLAVGRNRFTVALLQFVKGQPGPEPLPDAQVNLKFFFPIAPQPVLKSEATPQFRYVDDKRKGLYVAQVQFDQPGRWGVVVEGLAAGQPLAAKGTWFDVKARPDTPAIGSPAPRSRNLTRHDVDDIRKIDSGIQPNDMHELTIADAIEEKKPLVVLFASPGFCVTQTCAPQLGEVQKLKAKYGPQANFIHIEIFKDPMTRTPYETVKEWGLTSEPWVFMVDRAGLVAEKFEGPAPFAELEPALQKLI